MDLAELTTHIMQNHGADGIRGRSRKRVVLYVCILLIGLMALSALGRVAEHGPPGDFGLARVGRKVLRTHATAAIFSEQMNAPLMVDLQTGRQLHGQPSGLALREMSGLQALYVIVALAFCMPFCAAAVVFVLAPCIISRPERIQVYLSPDRHHAGGPILSISGCGLPMLNRQPLPEYW